MRRNLYAKGNNAKEGRNLYAKGNNAKEGRNLYAKWNNATERINLYARSGNNTTWLDALAICNDSDEPGSMGSFHYYSNAPEHIKDLVLQQLKGSSAWLYGLEGISSSKALKGVGQNQMETVKQTKIHVLKKTDKN